MSFQNALRSLFLVASIYIFFPSFAFAYRTLPDFDNYLLLGVNRSTPPSQIDSTFERLKSPDIQVRLAYWVLSDVYRKEIYKKFGNGAIPDPRYVTTSDIAKEVQTKFMFLAKEERTKGTTFTISLIKTIANLKALFEVFEGSAESKMARSEEFQEIVEGTILFYAKQIFSERRAFDFAYLESLIHESHSDWRLKLFEQAGTQIRTNKTLVAFIEALIKGGLRTEDEKYFERFNAIVKEIKSHIPEYDGRPLAAVYYDVLRKVQKQSWQDMTGVRVNTMIRLLSLEESRGTYDVLNWIGQQEEFRGHPVLELAQRQAEDSISRILDTNFYWKYTGTKRLRPSIKNRITSAKLCVRGWLGM